MPPDLSYDQALAYVASLEGRGWRLGLDRMNAFCDRLGLRGSLRDGESPKFIHVAGTNGKGSVTAFIQSILVEAGFRVGGYFSPYVYDIRERIQFQGQLIPKVDFARLVSEIAPIADSFAGSDFDLITEFEFKTAMGFTFWKEMECDWVACEVGLGGRLDATNVLTPTCSVITSIGLDHTQLLGLTHPEIAREKAGIIKSGAPVIVGDAPFGASETIQEVATENQSPIWSLGRELIVTDTNLSNPVRSISLSNERFTDAIQRANALLAMSAIDAAQISVPDDTIVCGLENARLPGRRQEHRFRGVDFVLDGAHNAESAHGLNAWLKSRFGDRKIVLLTSMLLGHEPETFYSELSQANSDVVLTSIDFFRAADPNQIKAQISEMFERIEVEKDQKMALSTAMEIAGDDGVVVVTGSFYLVGAIGRMIGADRVQHLEPKKV